MLCLYILRRIQCPRIVATFQFKSPSGRNNKLHPDIRSGRCPIEQVCLYNCFLSTGNKAKAE